MNYLRREFIMQDWDSQTISLRGVSNDPIQFRGARKIWPLLELLPKIR